MGSIYLRKYGVAATVDFCLYELDGTDLKVDAVSASGDITLNRGEAGVETLDADAFADLGSGYSLALSIAEMTTDRIIVYIIDQTNPKAWLDKVLIIETYGNASAQHPFDLATTTQAVNVTQIGGIAQSATDLKDFADTGYDPATHKVQGLVLCDTTTTNTDMVSQANITAIKNKTDNLPSDPADESLIEAAITAAHTTTNNKIDAVDDYVDTEVAAILAAVDTEVAAIKAVTDTLTLAAIADSVLDEVVDANNPANANSLREVVNIMSAALAGKSSGGGTANIKFRDLGDTKDRITATVTAVGDRTAITDDGT